MTIDPSDTIDLVDTHAHLDGDAYSNDLASVLDRATQAGVRRIVSAGQDAATSAATLALSADQPAIAPAVGVHPHEAKNAGGLEWLEGAAKDRKSVV